MSGRCFLLGGRIRFSAEKPRRLRQSTGLSLRAAFRILCPPPPNKKPDLWRGRIRFAFLPLAKIKVATSVCTGGSKCPPDTCTAMGSNPTPLNHKKDTPFGVSFLWWGRTDSNHRSDTQQIYSLSPLATRELPHIQFPTVCLEPGDGLG